MSMINKTLVIEQKKELEESLGQIANQLVWIERKYSLKVNEHILQSFTRQEKDILKVQLALKYMLRSNIL